MEDVVGDRLTLPRISVVIPAYNAEATLSRALESVLGQSLPAHEVVVVDDGSTDRTAEVARRHQGGATETRVICLSQPNAGPSAARNLGVEHATGDWIAFLDADDWYYPERLARHARLITARPGLDFLVGGFDYVDADGQRLYASMTRSPLGRRLLASEGSEGFSVIEGQDLAEFIVDQFSDTRMLTLRRSTFLAQGGFPSGLKICEDVVFLLRLCARSCHVGVDCRPGAVYVVHDAGLIRSNRLRAQVETVRALRGEAERMATAPAHIRAAWQILVKRAYLNLAFHLAKERRRRAAAMSVLRSFMFKPAAADWMHLASVVRR